MYIYVNVTEKTNLDRGVRSGNASNHFIIGSLPWMPKEDRDNALRDGVFCGAYELDEFYN
ncbi:MAG: hypothetical protein Q4A33_03025 [Candidatus Saccharibacteria bacterium]|nr:hypothetical protein [Candidatus Saccharibacteria bacterium]